MGMSNAATPFWYGGSDRSIVALTVGADGVEVGMSWPCEDRASVGCWLSWSEFLDMARDVAAVAEQHAPGSTELSALRRMVAAWELVRESLPADAGGRGLGRTVGSTIQQAVALDLSLMRRRDGAKGA